MCEAHGNHRTGNCVECRHEDAHRPVMPQVWDGDDS